MPEIATLLSPIATGALDAIEAIIPVGVPVLVLLIALGVGLRLFGKFGIKR